MGTKLRFFQRRLRTIAGYEAADLVDVIVQKTCALDNADHFVRAAPGDIRLPTLLALALSGDHVLDFGGAAGLHYRVARHAFPDRHFRWAIVETPLMVKKSGHLSTQDFRFFADITAACNWLGRVALVHSVGSLQYTREPELTLAALIGIGAPLMLWTKLALAEQRATIKQKSFLRENGAGPLPPGVSDAEVLYMMTTIRETDFMAAHHNYRTVWHDDRRAFLFSRQN